MADSDSNTSTFKVTDRRAFDSTGERKDAAQPGAETVQPQGPRAEGPASEPSAAAQPAPEPEPSDSARSLPPADLPTLLLSLGSSAVMYLGETAGPDGKKPPRNLPMAKHAIDLLTVLEEKTKGNRTAEEEQILESLLFDLRLRYVEALKAP